jgi:predicted RNA-binding protein YlqC (UPF0109 family)
VGGDAPGHGAGDPAPPRERVAPRPYQRPTDDLETEDDEAQPAYAPRLQDLVAYMARGLVDHPDDVEVDVLAPGEDAAFELRVHPDDLGHVIGKQGRTARSLRLALGAAAGLIGRRASLEIAD